MKKVLVIGVLAIAALQFSNAQEVGIRFGQGVGNNVAVDLVWGFNAGRIHADVSFGDGVGVEALYDFLYAPLSGENLYYYVGVGAFANISSTFGLGLSAEAGLEYRFGSVPLALGIDWRPAFQIIETTSFHANQFGLNVRWVF